MKRSIPLCLLALSLLLTAPADADPVYERWLRVRQGKHDLGWARVRLEREGQTWTLYQDAWTPLAGGEVHRFKSRTQTDAEGKVVRHQERVTEPTWAASKVDLEEDGAYVVEARGTVTRRGKLSEPAYQPEVLVQRALEGKLALGQHAFTFLAFPHSPTRKARLELSRDEKTSRLTLHSPPFRSEYDAKGLRSSSRSDMPGWRLSSRASEAEAKFAPAKEAPPWDLGLPRFQEDLATWLPGPGWTLRERGSKDARELRLFHAVPGVELEIFELPMALPHEEATRLRVANDLQSKAAGKAKILGEARTDVLQGRPSISFRFQTPSATGLGPGRVHTFLAVRAARRGSYAILFTAPADLPEDVRKALGMAADKALGLEGKAQDVKRIRANAMGVEFFLPHSWERKVDKPETLLYQAGPAVVAVRRLGPKSALDAALKTWEERAGKTFQGIGPVRKLANPRLGEEQGVTGWERRGKVDMGDAVKGQPGLAQIYFVPRDGTWYALELYGVEFGDEFETFARVVRSFAWKDE